MIIRLIAVDPRPRLGAKTDLVVYQLPEKSREYGLLTELLNEHGIDYAVIESKRKSKKGKS